jgi:hypothetical protein
MSNLTWPTARMAKFIDVSPRRLQQLVQEGVIPKCEARGRYNPIAVNLAYIRFLRDRVQSPEASDSEFFACKLAKLRAEREQIELQNQITRAGRIPVDDVLLANDFMFKAIATIIKASKLPIESCNEIFDEMRRVARLLKEKANQVDNGASDNGFLQNKNAIDIDLAGILAPGPICATCRHESPDAGQSGSHGHRETERVVR